jgi:ribose-phosphate pyrophosphokinase
MNFEIVAHPASLNFAKAVAKNVHKEVIVPHFKIFADGEFEFSFENGVDFTDKKIFIVASICPPVHDSFIAFALLVHHAKMRGAQEIVGVMPYLGYARHDKGINASMPGQMAMITQLISATGISALIVGELHVPEAIAYFSIPVIHIDVTDLIIDHIKEHVPQQDNICIVAPDKGAQERCLSIADSLGTGNIIFNKERYESDATKIVSVLKNYEGSLAIIVDDMIDTGGTFLNAVHELRLLGYEKILCYGIHPVFSGEADKKIEAAMVEKVFVSNSIPLKNSSTKIETFDISMLFAQTIKNLVI